jgi:hypothetical protein
VFTFLTIYKFGAVNCAVIGLIRKIVSLLLSFAIYKHSLDWTQGLGLVCAISAMVLNFCEKGSLHGLREDDEAVGKLGSNSSDGVHKYVSGSTSETSPAKSPSHRQHEEYELMRSRLRTVSESL